MSYLAPVCTEIFFTMFGNSFVLSQWQKVKTPNEFSKGKLFGKEKVRTSMFVWSKVRFDSHARTITCAHSFTRVLMSDGVAHRASQQAIHTSMTKIDVLLSKPAVLCFKNILGYMGDKVMQYPSMLGREIVEKAIQEPELRDEVYVQLIKQTTSNPNPYSPPG